MKRKTKTPLRLSVIALIFSILTSVSVLLLFCLENAGFYVQQNIGFFTAMAIEPIFLLSCLVSFLLALWSVITRRHLFPSYAAVTIQVVTLLALTAFNLPARVKRWNFHSRLNQRMIVVELARTGALSARQNGPCDCYYADLPKQYANVSAGGEVLISHHSGGFSVTFFIGRWGMFPDDDYTGYIFRSDDLQPQTGIEDTDRFITIQLIQPHWFYVQHS